MSRHSKKFHTTVLETLTGFRAVGRARVKAARSVVLPSMRSAHRERETLRGKREREREREREGGTDGSN